LRERPGVRIDDGASSAHDGAFQASGGLSEIDRSDRAAALQLALHLLEPEEQEILELAIAQNLGVERAAVALGISSHTARGRCERARKRLALKLRGWSELIG
jgi:DNA-directed RNA polymerase specialized sigma24 family protein